MMKKFDLTKIKAPVIFQRMRNYRYYNPSVWIEEDKFYLSFTKLVDEGDKVDEFRMISTSFDLTFWSEPKELMDETLNSLKGTRNLYNEEFSDYHFLFSEGKEIYEGSILLSISRDGEHWIDFEYDKATYPDNGIIYEGDYYKALPFFEYIYREDMPVNQVFDIRDYGAIGDGKTLSTEAFLGATNAARKNGGGTILVAGGYYCVGTVQLYDNMTLFIDADSALVASKNLDNFQDAFLACIDVKNICIRGGGKIIGNGEYFVHLPLKMPLIEPLSYTKLPSYLYDPMGYPVDTIRYAYRSRIRYAEDRYGEGLPKIHRPMYTVWIRGCENVIIQNVIIEDALDWTLDIDYCNEVSIKDVVINGNRHVANTDGIDIMSSKNVSVDHCFISCADDGLCIKAPLKQGHDGINLKNGVSEMGPVENVHISNCTVVSVMNAFKIGTETYFDIKNVLVENCKFMLPDIYPGGVSGISIESADGSHVSQVTLRNILMEKIACPIFICLNMRNKFGFLDEVDQENRYYGGSIENITIENVKAYDVEVPSIITGFEITDKRGTTEKMLKNITIKNVFAIYRDNDEVLDLQEIVVENIRDYPENNGFGDVPAYGFYIRHGQDISLENIEVIPRTCNTRACIYKDEA